MRRVVPSLVLALVLTPLAAHALSLRDVIELHRSGLSEEVLLALIEVDRSIFAIDAATIKSLKTAGLSERVIIAMIKSGRTPTPPPPAPAAVVEPEPVAPPAAPQPVVVIEHRDAPEVREVAVPFAVFVPIDGRSRRIERPRFGGDPYGPLRRPPVIEPIQPQKKAEPVFWGFGGKLRPDAWKPTPDKAEKSDKSDKRRQR
jgi:hypothetical protein